MPNPLLSTGDEGKNQDGHALVGAKDDALSSTCSHQTFATRDEMKSNIKNRICIENLYHSFRIAGTYDGCGSKTSVVAQTAAETDFSIKHLARGERFIVLDEL